MADRPRVWNKRDGDAPDDAVYIGRPSKWGNPYVIGEHGTRERVIECYRFFVELRHNKIQRELKGKHLVCFCAPLPCHGVQ